MVVLGQIRKFKLSKYTIYLKLENDQEVSFALNKTTKYSSRITVLQLKLGNLLSSTLLEGDQEKLFRVFRTVRFEFSALNDLTLCSCTLNSLSHKKIICLLRFAPLLQTLFFEDMNLSEALMTSLLKFLEMNNRKVNFLLFNGKFQNLILNKEKESMYLLSRIAQHGINTFHMQFSTDTIETFKVLVYTAVDMISRTRNDMKVHVGSQAGWDEPFLTYCNDLNLFLYMNTWQTSYVGKNK